MIVSAASELKILIQQEMASPFDALVRNFARQLYASTLTVKIMASTLK